MNLKNIIISFLLVLPAFTIVAQETNPYPASYATTPRFKALISYTTHAEEAHVVFARQTVGFFKKLSWGEGYILDVTTDFSQYGYEKLKEYDIVIMPDGCPGGEAERKIFEKYMENGGGWLGFHASAYNDKNTNWPWRQRVHRCNTKAAIYQRIPLGRKSEPER